MRRSWKKRCIVDLCVYVCVGGGGGGVGSHLNSLIVKEGVNCCVACIIVCFVHFYPETSPVCRNK